MIFSNVCTDIIGKMHAPSILRFDGVGLDIGETAVRFVELKKKGKEFIPKRFGSAVYQKDDKKDPSKTLLLALKKIKSQCPNPFVSVSVADENSYVFKTTIQEDTEDAVLFKIEENVPLDPRKVVFNYEIVGREDGGIEAVVTVISEEVISSLADTLISAGFIPTAFYTRGQAIIKTIKKEYQKENTFFSVDVGAEIAEVCVVKNGVVHYCSSGTSEEDALIDLTSKVYTFWQRTNNNIEEKINAYFSGEEAKKVMPSKGWQNIPGLSMENADIWANCFDSTKRLPPIPKEQALSFACATGLALLALNQ